MNISYPTTNLAEPILLSLDALERLEALRNMPAASARVLWAVLIGAIVVLIALLAAILTSRWISGKKSSQKVFSESAHAAGLSPEEAGLLARIAQTTDLKDTGAIFTMESAFNEGMSNFVRRRGLVEMVEQERNRAFILIQSLREKLGFVHSAEDDFSSSFSTCAIPIEAKITVAYRAQAEGIQMAVKNNTGMELTAKGEKKVDFIPGEPCLIRFSHAGTVREFDVAVIRVVGRDVVFNHANSVRLINRRRFPRISTDGSALISPFPFCRPELGLTCPEFEKGRLIEVAGPGLKILAPIEIATGDRVLVIVQFGDSKVITGIGRARRVVPGSEGTSEVAVELLGLSSSEISVLTQETNVAARENQTEAAVNSKPSHRREAEIANV